MADDITLTVRVRDMTRGEFNQIRQRMRGMDGDVRRLTQSTNGASTSADRFGRSIQGVQGRLGQLQRTGTLARSEMDFMRRSMGLLGRDLRQAAQSGELTEDQFRALRNELERTRLDFDHLDNSIRRHNAVAQRAHREELARQREAARQQREAEREAARLQREAERRSRDERRRQEALARSIVSARRRIAQAHAAALREEAQRNRRAEAERQRAARQAAATQRREVGRLAGLGGDDQGLAIRFRALGTGDVTRMTRSFDRLQRAMAGVSGSSAQARRSVRALGGDLSTMARALREAQDSGNLTRRDFNALSNGLRLASRDIRLLRRSGDLTRSSFRDMRRDVTGLQAQLRLLGREGGVFDRLGDRTILLQRRLRDTRQGAGIVRRSLSRLGEGGAGGLRLMARSLGVVASGLGRVRDFVTNASRGMKLFLAVLALIGPLAAPIGALLTTALGGAFIALGAFALRADKQVRSAFSSMKSTISVTMRAAAQPLRAALVVGMGEAAQAVEEMGNALTEAFAAAAPLVSNFVGAFTDLASRALPGVVQSLREMGPVIEGFRDAMGSIGEGVGEMFAAMTAEGGAEGLRKVWELVGDEVSDLLVDIGEFINAMSQSATATTLLKTIFEALSAILIVIEGVFRAIDAVLGPLIKKMGELGITGGLLGIIAKGLESIGVSAVNTEASTGKLTDSLEGTAAAQNEAAVKTLSHVDALKKLNEQIEKYNTENLRRFDAEAALNETIAKSKENISEYGKSVKITNGIFDTTHENTRKVSEDFRNIARDTAAAAQAAKDANAPLSAQNKIWADGETAIRNLGKAYGIPKAELDAFIGLVLKTPKTATTEIELKAEDAKNKAAALLVQMQQAKGFKAKMKASLEAGAALRDAANLQNMLNALNGRVTSSRHVHTSVTTLVQRRVEETLQQPFGASGGLAGSLPRKGFANGGSIAGALLDGPGTETSDSLIARLSRGEFVMQASAVRRFGVPFMDAINKGRFPGFAKGGLTQGEKEARSEARGQLTLSRFGRMAWPGASSFVNQLINQSVGDLVGALNKWRGIIQRATRGGVEKNLLRQLDRTGKALITYQHRLNSVNTRLESAKARLDELKSAASQLRDSVKQTILGEAGITRSATAEESQVTINTLLSQMAGSAAQSTQFASMLQELQKKGLDKTLIEQIAQAGVTGGGFETAAAILGGGTGDIRRLNDLQQQITKAAGAAGDTAADAMFGAGIKAAEGLVKGLLTQQKVLEKAMLNLAKSMEKAIKNALGIKSPSRVMQEVGHNTAEGFAMGIRRNKAPRASWESMLNVPRSSAGTSGTTASSQPFVVYINIGDQRLGELVIDPLRRSIRHRGGDVQAVLGK